jgi:hypothetical protein
MITNDQLKVAIAYNSLTHHLEKVFKDLGTTSPGSYAAAKKRIDGIVQYAAGQSSEMALPTPEVYVSMLTTQADQTKEG